VKLNGGTLATLKRHVHWITGMVVLPSSGLCPRGFLWAFCLAVHITGLGAFWHLTATGLSTSSYFF